MSRALTNTMINLGIQGECDEAMYQVRTPAENLTILPNIFTSHKLPACIVKYYYFLSRGGDSHMKQTRMLVGNFEFNP